jgi:NAD(P)H-hydrate repair Nnr-like enzyme with NAD(P)H-hydrate dehydratase domain
MRARAQGLGRGRASEDLFHAATGFVAADVLPAKVPVVWDGDALWFAAQQSAQWPGLMRGRTRHVLTANEKEFERLWQRFIDRKEVPFRVDWKTRMETSASMAQPDAKGGLLSFSQAKATIDVATQKLAADRKELFDSSKWSAPKAASALVEDPPQFGLGVVSWDHPLAWHASVLSRVLGGVLVCRKGSVDVISDGRIAVYCAVDGSPRRCGGQGDVLAGLAAVPSLAPRNGQTDRCPDCLSMPLPVRSLRLQSFSGWAAAAADAKAPAAPPASGTGASAAGAAAVAQGPSELFPPTMVGTLMSCLVLRHSATAAFALRKRSMLTTDIIAALPDTFEALFPLS